MKSIGCVLGIDIGTSGCKAIVVDEAGSILSSATAEYPIYQPKAGYSEQEPEDWWQGVIESVRAVMHADRKLLGISLSGQMHGMVALDDKNTVVRRAILWNDQRTQAQCDEITEMAGGLDGLLGYTNNMMLTGYTGGKLLWLRETEPQNYEKTKLVINPKDYIRFKLTGELLTEVSDASGTGLFDVENRRWAYGLIDKLGIDRSLFAKCVESTDQAGTVTKQAAALTGLPEGTRVYAGGGDAVISTMAMGLAKAGTVGVTLGTSGVVAMGLPAYGHNRQGLLQLFCNNTPNTWMAFGCTLAAAGSYQWFRNALCEGNDYDGLNKQAEAVEAGCDGLIYLPYLTGERCPLFDPKASGGFIGITSRMGKGHFSRAVMEGVCFSLKQVYDLIADCAPVDTKEIVVSGGGAKSRLWRKILADIFGLPVITASGSAEGGAFGAALIAGIGCGIWTVDEAMKLVKPQSRTMPDNENEAVYKRQYEKYCRLYSSLKWFYED